MKKILLCLIFIICFNLLNSIEFTEAEKQWLKGHQVLRIAPDPHTPPIEWFDENGDYKGIAAEFMNILEDKLQVEFEIVHCRSWNEVLDKAKNKEVDIIPAGTQTPERSEYMISSEPYLIFPGVIITRTRNRSLSSTFKLNHKKVCVVSGYIWHEALNRDYPEIELIPVDNSLMGLRKVSLYEADAFVGIYPIALHHIEEEAIHNLTVAGETEYNTEISILSRKDWPILNSIIQKALNNIPESEKQQIHRKWVPIPKITLLDNPVFFYILLALALLVAITIIIISVINRALRRMVKERTKELEESRRTYLQLFQNALVGMFRIDIENGKMIDFNDKILQMLKYDNREELQSDFVVSEKIIDKNNWEQIKKTMFREHEINDLKASFKTKDGSNIWVKLSAKINHEGNWVEGIAEDITEQKKAEDELQILQTDLKKKVQEQTVELENKIKTLAESEKAMLFMVEDLNKVSTELKNERKQLKQANKDLEAFSYSVSHDLRAPLRAISGFIRIMLEDHGNELDDEGKRLAEVINNNAKKMGKLIDDLLTFSRLGKKAITPNNIDMKTMVNSIYHEVTDAQQRKQIEFKIGDIPDITADTNMMRIVWANLISNAVKFTSNNKKPVIKVEAEAKDNLITYRIKDNGIGFEPEFADNLFKVFQRLHSEKDYSGTGVGLALVKRIIEQHNGSIAANSKPGKGATFYFSLPK